jgi:hypothetical protein
MSVARARTLTHEILRDRILVVFLVTVVLDFVCAWLALFLERDRAGSDITNYGDALFWTTVQMLTVSSQMPNPVTTGGRILDVFLEAYAIIVVATLAGSFGAFFHRRGEERRAEANA